MAASQPSGGGIETTLQFPLYIYFDYCEEFWGMVSCYANGDFAELVRYLKQSLIAFGEQTILPGGVVYSLEGDDIKKIGAIYIEDSPLTEVYYREVQTGLIEYRTETHYGTITSSSIVGDL